MSEEIEFHGWLVSEEIEFHGWLAKKKCLLPPQVFFTGIALNGFSHTNMIGLSTVYFNGLQIRIFKLKCISVSEDWFCLSKHIVDPNEILHLAVFHLGFLHCLPN